MQKKCANYIKPLRLYLFFFSLLIVIIDQLTKYYVRNHLVAYETYHFLPMWDWSLKYNTGVAFSFFDNGDSWQKPFFGFIALGAAIGIAYYLLTKKYTRITGFALSLILSGAIGNLIDRLMLGKVTDFIDWHIGVYHWPTFNVADSAITVAVTLLLIEALFINNKLNAGHKI